MTTLFMKKAPVVMGWLMHDFGLTDFQAAGIVGNVGRESAGFALLREVGQPSGRGGYGWCQWTGARAKEFMGWCRQNDFDWHGDAGNYGYLKHELQGVYASAVTHVRHAKTVEEATEIFEENYERAGVPAIASRVQWAKLALSAYRGGKK